jgi:hypothetical protein
MHKTAKNSKNDRYPKKTAGSKLAAKARKLANSLTNEQRTKCLDGAKSLVHGNPAAKAGVIQKENARS